MQLTLLSRLQSLKTWQLQKPKGSETIAGRLESYILWPIIYNMCIIYAFHQERQIHIFLSVYKSCCF